MAEITLLAERAAPAVLAKLNALLTEAIKLNRAAMGNIQIYDPRTKTLQIIAHQGFKKDFLSHFRVVKAADATACGRAAGSAVPVIIPDVERELGFEPHRAIAKSAGFRSVISVPILGAEGRLDGIISTHCREPRSDWDAHALKDLTPRIAALLETIRERSNSA